MNIKNIRALADIMNTKELSLIEIIDGETRIRLEKKIEAAAVFAPETKKAVSSPSTPLPENEELVDFNDITEVKAPLVGVFYTSPSPDAEAFVTIGKKVKKGDVLCIVEAMKLMNEICAEADGEIVDICAKNGDIVEFGQTLFKIY